MAKWPTSVATDADLSVAVNSLQTTLGSGIDAVVTTIPLASTTGFPTAGYVTIDNEVISYTGVSGGNLTGATRGADGTSAATHNTGAAVSATIVAAHHNSLKNEIEAIETDMNNAILTLTPATPGATATSIANRWAQLAQQLINIAGTTHWYDAISKNLTQLLALSGGTMSGNIAMGSNHIDGATYFAGSSFLATGNSFPASGIGVGIGYASGSSKGFIQAYDIGGNAYKALELDTTSLTVTNGSGTTFGTVGPASSGGCSFVGPSDGSNASAGYTREVFSATKTRSSASTLTTNTPINIASISLTPGDYDVWISVGFAISSGVPAPTSLIASISTASATLPGTSTYMAQDSNGQIKITRSVALTSGSDDDEGLFIQSRVNISSTTTYYCVAQATFGSGGINAYGQIYARRR